LIFAGGKSYLVSSDQVTVPVATNMCADKGMELLSLESLAETSVVQDFLGDLGLSTNTMLTSLKKLSGGDEFNWLGGVAASVMNWAPNQPAPGGGSECASLNSLGLSGITCDTVANFVCEAPGPSVVPGAPTTLPTEAALAPETTLAPPETTLPAETAPPAETTTL
jgi:Lectin C-type domain